MTQKKPSEVMAEIVDLLSPLESAERHRVVSAAFMLLGESKIQTSTFAKDLTDADSSMGETALPQKAQLWMKQNSLSLDAIEQIFHIAAGDVDIIAGSIPGKNNGEKTRNVYMLSGLANLLKTGDATFTDKVARDNCTTAGCYDASNHGKYLAGMGNEFSGSKAKGWTITAPGFKRGATLIKEMGANA